MLRNSTSFACVSSGMHSTWSMMMLPASAWTSRPTWRSKAPGKAPRSWPNSPRSDQPRRHRRAIDHHQPAAGARAGAVDRAGKDFLAGAGLAVDHHRHARARRLGGDRERAAEIGARPDDFLERQRRAQLFGERAEFALRAAGRGDPVERVEQAVGGDRFLDKIACPGAHRADRDLDPVAHRDDDQRQRGAPAAQFGDEFGHIHARRALIDKHGVERHAFLGAELGERGVGVAGDHAAPAATRHKRRQEALLRRFAVDDHHHSGVARACHRCEYAPIGRQFSATCSASNRRSTRKG